MSSITLWGAVYDTDHVDLPKTGGGTVRFSEGGGGGYTRTVTVEEQTVTPVSNGTYYSSTLNISEGFEADAEYIITLNGTEYFFTCQVMWGTNYLLGDINYFYGGSSLPYPFGIIWISGTTCTLARDNGNQVTVKIEKLELTGSGGGGGSATLITKTITANGTYSASDDSADGYSSVTVNVPSSAASGWTKVAETSYQVSTSSTTAATVDTLSLGNSIWTPDKIVYVRVRDTAGKRAGYFYGTDAFFLNFYAKNSPSSQGSLADGLIMNIWRVVSAGNYAWRRGYGTTGYGVYPDQFYSDGRIRIRSQYNSNYSLTINSTYKVEVYLLDPPTGAQIFT